MEKQNDCARWERELFPKYVPAVVVRLMQQYSVFVRTAKLQKKLLYPEEKRASFLEI